MQKLIAAALVAVGIATAGAASAQEVIFPPTPAPLPAPQTEGWVRVAPLTDNPTVIGGVRDGNTTIDFNANPNGGGVTITTPMPGG